MLTQNTIALKEWAVVVKALGDGRQTVLLRKGGIIEDRGEFTVEHQEFFFYPTYTHQQRDGIQHDAVRDLDAVMPGRPPEGLLWMDLYAVVEFAAKVTDLGRLHKIQDLHILTPSEVESRFYYGKSRGLWVLKPRLYRLPAPHTVPTTPAYAGCRSWVPLEKALSTEGAAPIQDDAVFSEQLRAIREVLG
jgi:hypothetical protein